MDDQTDLAVIRTCWQALDSTVRRLLSQPPFIEQHVHFTCPDSTADRVKHIADAYSKAYDAADSIEKMLAAREGQAGATRTLNDNLRAEIAKRGHNWRTLMLSIDMPFLVDDFTDTTQLLLFGIDALGWWDNPAACSLWRDWQPLLNSSQKLRFVVNEAQDRKEVTSEVRLGNGQVVRVKHWDKIIFATHEPIFAFCIYTVLVRSLEVRYGGIKEAMDAIKVVWRGAEMPDVVNKFQLEPDEDKTYHQPSVDIIIIVSRVGATGVRLTKANRLVVVDVDQSDRKIRELKNMYQCITQRREASFIQLVSDLFDLQETVLRRRGAGEQAGGGVIPLRR